MNADDDEKSGGRREMPEVDGARADLTNWRKPPTSAWAFWHVDELIPTATIQGGGGSPSIYAEPAPLEHITLQMEGGGALSFDDVLSLTRTDALLVMHRGHVVFERYAAGAGPSARHILMSASKSLVGLLAGMLIGRGVLDPDAPVTAILPECAGTAYEGATIRHLLDMRADPALTDAELQAYAKATGWEALHGELSGGMHAFFQSLPARKARHGGPFRYISANTDLLGWLIEWATGRDFASVARDLLWSVMGSAHDAFITLDPAGTPRTTGGICATPRDFAQVGQVLLGVSSPGASNLVPSSWLEDTLSHGDRQAWAAGDFAQAFGCLPMHYRNGWYVVNGEPRTMFAMGTHGQNLFVDPTNEIVVAKLSSQAAPIDPEAIRLTHRLVPAIRKVLADP